MEFADFMENSAKTPSFVKGINRAKVKLETHCGAFVFDYSDIWGTEKEDFVHHFNIENEEVVA